GRAIGGGCQVPLQLRLIQRLACGQQPVPDGDRVVGLGAQLEVALPLPRAKRLAGDLVGVVGGRGGRGRGGGGGGRADQGQAQGQRDQRPGGSTHDVLLGGSSMR